MVVTERIVGPCSKHVSGEGWVTEVPVTAIEGRGYVKEKFANLEERVGKDNQKVWICTHCGILYMNMDRSVLEKMFKYCPHCGAKVVAYLSIKAQIIRRREEKSADNS